MKHKLTSKEKFMAEIKKVLERIKPVQEKIEKTLAESPTFQKWAKSSTPWRQKITASVTAQLEKAKFAADTAEKEIRDLKEQYKEDPKKVFKTTLSKVREIAKVPKRFQKKKRSSVTPIHSTKSEKRVPAAVGE